MKRLLSDDIEPVMKRVCLRVSSTSSTLEINDDEEEIIIDESIISLDSQIETDDDDDFLEIVYENSNSTCQQTDNTILIISDSDNDLSIDTLDIISSPISSIISPSIHDNFEAIEKNPELIDLTDDDPNQLKRKSSIDIQQCPICLETLSDLQHKGVYLIITSCHHIMCTLCSRQLLLTSSRCPLCRENVNSSTLIPYCILT